MAKGNRPNLEAAQLHRAKVQAAEGALEKVAARLQGAEKALADLGPGPDADALRTRRADLMAEEALGEDRKKELQEVERELSEAGEGSKASKKRAELGDTVDGLLRRHDSLAEELAALDAQTPGLAASALWEEAQSMASLYREQVEALGGTLGRLVGLDDVLEGLGAQTLLVGGGGFSVELPAFGRLGLSGGAFREGNLLRTNDITIRREEFSDKEARAIQAAGACWPRPPKPVRMARPVGEVSGVVMASGQALCGGCALQRHTLEELHEIARDVYRPVPGAPRGVRCESCSTLFGGRSVAFVTVAA